MAMTMAVRSAERRERLTIISSLSVSRLLVASSKIKIGVLQEDPGDGNRCFAHRE